MESRVAFVGGEDDFYTHLTAWLNRVSPHYATSQKGLGVSTPNNTVSFRGPTEEIEVIWQAMTANNDLPDGLKYAKAGPKTPDSKRPRFVRGKKIDEYDSAGKRMAHPGRKVGVTPREIAEAGGW